MVVVGWLLAGISFGGISSPAQAQDTSGPDGWRITPRIGIGTIYSDNIRLVPVVEAEEDVVLQVEPGLSVYKRGGRLDLRLDYAAQGLLYSNNGEANKINNQLQAFGTAKLIERNLFLDAYGFISQVPVNSTGRTDAGNLGASGRSLSSLSFFGDFDLRLPGDKNLFNISNIFDDIALTNNQATAYRLGLSPYWRQNFQNWANVLLRYRHEEIFYDREDDDGGMVVGSPSNTGDSQIDTVDLNLISGSQLSKLKLIINYFYQRDKTDGQIASPAIGEAVTNKADKRERATAELNYRLDREWALLGEVSYENNDVANFENSPDGVYWGVGGIWTPNRFLEIKGLYGPDVNEIAGRWNPSTRTRLEVSRRKQDFGVNPGVRWNGLFNHRTRSSVWSLRYVDEVTNEQQLFGSNLLGVDANGQPLPLVDGNQAVVSEGSLGLTDQNFRRKRLDAGVSYRLGPTGLSFNIFNEDRETPGIVRINETMYGAGALWAWRFAPRTASFLGAGWERDDLGANQLGETQQNEYWVSVIGLARVFTPNSGGMISYRYYENDAEPGTQGFRENRLNVRFNMKF